MSKKINEVRCEAGEFDIAGISTAMRLTEPASQRGISNVWRIRPVYGGIGDCEDVSYCATETLVVDIVCVRKRSINVEDDQT